EPGESARLFQAILINHTTFFRDTAVWDALATRIIPQTLARRRPDEPLRIWSAGCATGAEVYSLAILLATILGLDQYAARVRITATDVDDEALRQVRAGRYHALEVRNVPPDL